MAESELAKNLGVELYTVNPANLPQTPLGAVHANAELLPWVEIGIGIQFKVLSCCNKTGRYVILTKYPPGTQLPPHRHSGQVFGYTIQGKWGYVEHDFTATAGSIVHETANSHHTLKVHDDSPVELIFLALVEGNLITYDEQGNIWAIDDGQTQLEAYLRMAKEQGIEVDESLIARW